MDIKVDVLSDKKEGRLFVARGCTLFGQENTIVALNAAVADASLYGAEISVLTTHGGQCVLCHDQNLMQLVGLDIDIRTLDRKQIEALTILKTIKGQTYPNTAKFMFLDEAFALYVAKHKNDEKNSDEKNAKGMALWLSVKNPGYRPWSWGDETAAILVNELHRLKHTHNMDKIYISSTNPFLVSNMKSAVNAQGLNIFYDYSNWGYCDCIQSLLLCCGYGIDNNVALDKPFATLSIIERLHSQNVQVISYDIGNQPRPKLDDFLLVYR